MKKAPAVLLSLAVLTSTCLAQPANDNFANRIAITGTSASVTGSNVGATKEPGEPNHGVFSGYSGFSGGASAWWSWVAPAASSARLDTIGSRFYTILAVYTGTNVSNLTGMAAAGQSLYTNSVEVSQVGFVPTAGVEYQIAVDTEWGDTGNIVLHIVTGAPFITFQPQTQGVAAGSNVTFSVTAIGDPPFSYQWVRLGPKSIPNATNSTLTLTNLQLTNAGGYYVVVTNNSGSITSLTAVLSLPVSEPYLFTTIAGKAGSGSADGTGDVARFNNPAAVAVDSAGNLYVADRGNDTIRKIAPLGTNWVVTTLAGTAGVSGFVDGTNSGARFTGPYGVAVDGAGNLYVTDRGNGAVRKIAPQGTNWVVSTIATGFSAPGGCAVDASGNIFVADTSGQIIRKIAKVGTNWVVTVVAGGTQGSADGTNTAAQFHSPDRVAVDATGNLYVGDAGNNIIRKITLFGTNWVVSTLAGQARQPYAPVDGTNSSAGFYNPEGVAVDTAGSVYVAEAGNYTVRKITPNGVTTTLGGLASASGEADGAGGAARFASPFGVAVDSHGTVYVADYLGPRIRMGRPVIQMQPAPAALSGQIQTQGFGCSICLASGLNYRIQTSSNLSAWEDLTNFAPTGLTYSFWDSGATNLPQRFYRVVGP